MAVAVVERRRDGKLYPAGGSLPEPERFEAIRLAHQLHCRDGLSYRATRLALEDHGIRRSLGQVFSDLASYECEWCADG